jgi:hypothetical protein
VCTHQAHAPGLQEEAREAVASPVEAIADSLDEQATEDDKGGGKLRSAIQGEFGEYDFDDAQLQVCSAAISLRMASSGAAL